MEIWKPIKEFQGQYEVSNIGRVRSMWFLRKKVFKRITILKTPLNTTGYPYIMIKKKVFSIHRVVLEAFVGACPENHECAHLNGIRSDPRLENLKWVTHKDNMEHRKSHGTHLFGETVNGCKLKSEQVIKIRKLRQCGIKPKEIAKAFNMSRSHIYSITNGVNWKHL